VFDRRGGCTRITKDGKLTTFTRQNDLDILTRVVTQVGASFVVADAITSYMSKVENKSTADIRAVLDRVAEWAQRVVVIGITTPKAAQKSALRQFTGSLAYVWRTSRPTNPILTGSCCFL
jgi:hypothetical protein